MIAVTGIDAAHFVHDLLYDNDCQLESSVNVHSMMMEELHTILSLAAFNQIQQQQQQ